MANNLIQFKRTSTTGLGPNTTNAANNAYIPAGSFAVNLTDKKVFGSDGTNAFDVGANVTTQYASANVWVGNGAANVTIQTTGIVVTVNSTASSFLNSTAYSARSGTAYSNVNISGFQTSAGSINIGNTATNTVINTTAIIVGGNVATFGTTSYFVANGNVGFGTSGPRAKLDVAGDIWTDWGDRFIGTVYLTGNQYRLGIKNIVNTRDTQIWSQSADGAGVSGVTIYTGATPSERVRVAANGNVGISTTTPSYTLQVNGSFAATTKSFVIEHPTREGMKLRYGSLEGPENGVYVRGRLTGSNTIELPDYWTGLIDEESITVNLTPIGSHQNLFVKDTINNKIIVGNENLLSKEIDCFYTVFAERNDVEKLLVEYKEIK